MNEPSENHREEAEHVLDVVLCNGPDVPDHRAEAIKDIANAILAAEERGMKRGLERAAEIVGEFDDEDILLGKDVAEIARNSILSEITPSTDASSLAPVEARDSASSSTLSRAPIHEASHDR